MDTSSMSEEELLKSIMGNVSAEKAKKVFKEINPCNLSWDEFITFIRTIEPEREKRKEARKKEMLRCQEEIKKLLDSERSSYWKQ